MSIVREPQHSETMMSEENDHEDISESNITPEERLFRAVVGKGPASETLPEKEERRPPSKLQKKLDASLAAAKRSWQKFQVAARPYVESLPIDFKAIDREQIRQFFRLRNLNRVMTAIVIALAIYLMSDMIFNRNEPQRRWPEPEGLSDNLQIPHLSTSGINSSDYYTASLEKRNFFRPYVEPTHAQEIPGPAAPSPQETSNIRLVGISWDQEGFVAMIEEGDVKHAKFIREGDKLPGGVEVASIQEFSVSLKKGEHEWDLS